MCSGVQRFRGLPKGFLQSVLLPPHAVSFFLLGLQGPEVQQDPEDDHGPTEAGRPAAGWQQRHGLAA